MSEFEIWWQKNKDLYSLVGVKKEVAESIWNDACNIVSKNVLKIIKENS